MRGADASLDVTIDKVVGPSVPVPSTQLDSKLTDAHHCTPAVAFAWRVCSGSTKLHAVCSAHCEQSVHASVLIENSVANDVHGCTIPF